MCLLMVFCHRCSYQFELLAPVAALANEQLLPSISNIQFSKDSLYCFEERKSSYIEYEVVIETGADNDCN